MFSCCLAEPVSLSQYSDFIRLKSNRDQSSPSPDTIFEERTQQTKPAKDFNEKLDDHLKDMQSGIGRLKDLALSIGKEIDEQNEQLDVITNKADKTNTNLKVQNKQMLKHLGK